jgi:acyl-CoA synthetase (NDP forming)
VGIVVPYDQVLDVLQESHRKGTGSAIVISAGFAERGVDDRRDLQGELGAFARASGMRISGPNCLGLANVKHDIWATSSSRGASGLTGPIGLLCQSGAAAFGPFLMRAVENGIGFSYINSTGNENKQSRVSATPSLESFKSRRQHARQVVGTRLPFWKAMSAISAGSQ